VLEEKMSMNDEHGKTWRKCCIQLYGGKDEKHENHQYDICLSE
jgi:hypothetical protein